MAFYIHKFRQAQVFTNVLGQRFLSLNTLPACRGRSKSTKPSFIQWNSFLELSNRRYVPTTSNFHHLARPGAHLKSTKPPFTQLNSLELSVSGHKYVPFTSNFHHLAENTLNSNAAYFMKLGAFLVKPTQTNITTLERMGITVHYVCSQCATVNIKETESVKNASTKIPETEEPHSL